MSWTEQPIFFVDFEGSRASGVLEYGVATLLGGQVVETATRLCAATGRVRAEAAVKQTRVPSALGDRVARVSASHEGIEPTRALSRQYVV